MRLNLTSKFFIHATNVHTGGGFSLLNSILSEVPDELEVIAQLDTRMNVPDKLSKKITIRRIYASILQRLQAEWWLSQHVQVQDTILCFGNLPPMFRLRGHVVVFVQNRYLIDDIELGGFSLKARLRLCVERFWLLSRVANVNEFVVQTPTMKTLLEELILGRVPVRVLPFLEDHNGYVRRAFSLKVEKETNFEFLYVASGEPHKNHRQLIEAWCLLAKEGLYPRLKLTLDSTCFSELCSWIEYKVGGCKLNVVNVGYLTHKQVKQLYKQADALIYPSTIESFGLPLIEARQAGLSVIASELDYVRDVLDPEQVFDPASAISIARAVKRFIGIEEQPLPLQSAAEFIWNFLPKR